MKKLIILLFLTGFTSMLYAQQKEQKLKELFEAYAKLYKFNGSVLIAQNGKVLLNQGYGFKSISDSIPNDANTIYQIGSVTKQFTAAAILKLQEEKKLNVQDKISKYFPDFPKGDSITIEHLLTHTSGIFNYTNDPVFMQSQAVKPITEEKMIALFKNKPLNFAPGSKMSYSNSGYMLLGYIIQKLSKKPYEQAIREIIFNPLNMNSSGFDFTHFNNKDKATGYFSISQNGNIPATIVDSTVSYAAGAIYSTTADLYKWHKGLMSNEIVSKNSIDKAYTPYLNKYGYGWGIDSIYGKRLISHGGGIFGFTSNVARVTEDDIFIVMLNNFGNSNLGHITKDGLAILYEKPYKLPEAKKEISLSTDILKNYPGVYELSPEFSITITLENGSLFGQPTSQQKSQLFAQKENLFFLKVVDAEIEFKKDDNGKVKELILIQGGRNTVGKKVK
ncbi:serine hydrolase [Daejeonella oryzae]|uniref:serine hydrolase n=1 Tax=Daejeonella oryzae TaxID=1122943 RepID=UPI000410C750|nr:serine hydrolase [Daejeonella oryzae]